MRYDGRHKLDHYLKDKLGKIVDWVSVCPEVECGLSTPREAMRLAGTPESSRLVTWNSNIDHTERMVTWAKGRLEQLEKEGLCGFVFKSDSPSCGLNSVLSEKGIGIFAKEFTGRFKLMPVEDNDRLQDDKIREDFINRICAFGKACSAVKIQEK